MAEYKNPCLTCGACCAFYRASFYWSEGDDAPGGTVPASLTSKIDSFRRVMVGTSGSNPRCVALLGTIGEQVRCSIYDSRSSVCREFEAAWSAGAPNERCDRARAAWGLPPLAPPAVRDPDDESPPRPRRAA